MKTIRKNFLLLAFVSGALFFIGNNVLADTTSPEPPPDDQGGGTTYQSCMGYVGSMIAGAYRCDDPGYPSIPSSKCGTPFMRRTGRELVQCFL